MLDVGVCRRGAPVVVALLGVKVLDTGAVEPRPREELFLEGEFRDSWVLVEGEETKLKVERSNRSDGVTMSHTDGTFLLLPEFVELTALVCWAVVYL